jgi:uncharacterized sporulation protein YeaH/YhbH (DUF444 family)
VVAAQLRGHRESLHRPRTSAPARSIARPSSAYARTAARGISSAFRAARELLDDTYSADEWNIYLFHFSDGDNSSESDSRECCRMLRENILPVVNLFGYCQVASAYGSGNFINVLHEHVNDEENLITSRVNNKDDIYDSIKTFFSKGQ